MSPVEAMKHAEGIMAGCGCHQQADGSWIAKTGPMNTLAGHGKTEHEAKQSLYKKVVSVVMKRKSAAQ